jgi:hypothetical protein
MKKIKHPIYKDYPEQPYISPERDLEAWAKSPDKFHYGIIHKRDMIRTREGLLPGDIVMLWRIGFNNFTNESTIPAYFEYRYGVNSKESIALLIKKKYVYLCDVIETLPLLTIPALRRLLEKNKLAMKGNKHELLERVVDEIPETKLSKLVKLRRYQITEAGKRILLKYDDIIARHGPKV